VIVFRSLTKDDICKIVDLEIAKVGDRLTEHKIQLTISDAARDRLVEEGYDPDMGARPLRRVIQQKLEDQLSDAMLAHTFQNGDTILIDLDEDVQFTLRKGSSLVEPEAPLGVGA
jgi:ATP-dependent Clp protease ATP-binding subunit ClpC